MALTVGSISSSTGIPKSVAEITKDASDYEFNALVPLKYWLRTAAALIKQAQVYMKEGDDEMTYFLLFRHAHLCLSNLSTHPQYNKNDPVIKTLKHEISQNLKALELLKTRINRRHDEYLQVQRSKLERRKEESARRADAFTSVSYDAQPRQERSPVEQLRGSDNVDLAARLAGQEFSKRSSTRQTQPSGSGRRDERDDLVARMQAIRMRIDHPNAAVPTTTRQHPSDYAFNYPSVPIKPSKDRQQTLEAFQPVFEPASQQQQPPALPPKPYESGQSPAVPPKLGQAHTAALPPKETSEPSYTFAPGAQLENGTPLRTIFLPPTLRTTFLRLAQKNTAQNLETCGFLAGTLRANALFASALIVPKQTSTSDTCEMTDESELFDYVDQHELMILGWIHTHPTQTCFMSSRDLHTHSGYQMMLAESVAIVCAPSKGDTSHGGDWGVYRLTDPPGKMAILQCEKPGLFHPHDVDNIYTDAMRPGHVMEISGMDFEIVDLR